MGVAAMGEDHPFQEIQVSGQQMLQVGFDRMAAVGRKKGLGLVDLDRGIHQSEGMTPGGLNHFFRDERAKGADSGPVGGQIGPQLPIISGGEGFDFNLDFF